MDGKQRSVFIILLGAVVVIVVTLRFWYPSPVDQQAINSTPSPIEVDIYKPLIKSTASTTTQVTSISTDPQSYLAEVNLARQNITREDLIKENWPDDSTKWGSISCDDYSYDFLHNNATFTYKGEILHSPDTTQPPLNTVRLIYKRAYDSTTHKFYLLGDDNIGDATSTPLLRWHLYEIDMVSKKIREIASGKDFIDLQTFRCSVTQKAIDFVSYEDLRKRYSDIFLNIIDLADPTNTVRIEIPMDMKIPQKNIASFKKIKEHGFRGTDVVQDVIIFVSGYRFVDNDIIEFTIYYGLTTIDTELPQVSDKELWRYDKKTGKLTLLETIPFAPVWSLDRNTGYVTNIATSSYQATSPPTTH